MKLYKVTGNISGITTISKEQLITVTNRRDEEQAPVMLTTVGTFEHYIDELYGTDYEEKYMTKVITYTSWCDVERIDVLDDNGKIVKTITRDTCKDEYSQWLD